MKHYSNINLNLNELQYAVIQNLNMVPITASIGQIYYDITISKLKLYTAAGWVTIDSGGSSGPQTLNQVLTNGNVSILDAKIGDLYLWDTFTPTGYARISGKKDRIQFYGKTGVYSWGFITTDTYVLQDTAGNQFQIRKPAGTLSATSYAATFQMASGTIAYLSDIPSVSGFVPYIGATQAVDLGAFNLTVNNISVGKGAGTGINNTVLGEQSFTLNTIGNNNVAIGRSTLLNNTSGNWNTAIGSQAQELGQIARGNTSVGRGTLYNNLIGNFNVAIGYRALLNNIADKNTAIGAETMFINTTGVFNTVVGQEALRASIAGSYNSILGNFAILNAEASYVSALGRDAGRFSAAANLLTANESIFIGFNSKSLNTSSTNEIVIGANAVGEGDNTITIGHTTITSTRLRGAVKGGSFVKDGGTAAEYLMADGSVTIGGGVPSGSAGGDLSGTYPNPTVDGLQGQPISNATPINGQVLQYDGTSWVPGSIPSGGSGGGGVVYYLNFNTAADTPLTNIPQTPNTSKELGIISEATSTSYVSAILPTGSFTFLASFVTDLNTPSSTTIPAGLWDFNIYAESITSNVANETSFQIQILKYDGSNTPVLLAISNEIYIYDPTEITQYVASVILPQTTILATDRIVVYLYGKAYQNNNTLSFHFGASYPSHVHSTIPSVTGTGIVKVINSVFQSPASLLVDADVSATAAIAVSKLSMSTNKLLGRTTAGSGAVEEISLTTTGTGAATLTGTTLNIPTPSIPTIGTWGALNYPTWVSGTPFVKMTAAGTFALDTTVYYPNSNPANFVSNTFVATNYVPYTGATGSINIGANDIFTLGGAKLWDDGTVEGTTFQFVGLLGSLQSAASSNEAWLLPNQSGTIALLSDITAATNLDAVLTNGNISQIDAKVGGIFLYNNFAPSGNGYVSITGDKNRFNFYNNVGTYYANIAQDTLALIDLAVPTRQFQIQKPASIGATRTAVFQDASGTVAYLSDITTATTLDAVLLNGNVSQINANVGDIGIYNNHAPSGNGYVFITGSKNLFHFYNNIGTEYAQILQDTLILLDSSSSLIGMQIKKPASLTTNRVATFQDASGTVAYLSDIPTPGVTSVSANMTNPSQTVGITNPTTTPNITIDDTNLLYNKFMVNQYSYLFPSDGNTSWDNLRVGGTILTTGTVSSLSENPQGQLFTTAAATSSVTGFFGTNFGASFFGTNFEIDFSYRFRINTNNGAQRFFAGLSNMYGTATPTNIEPTTMINSIGVAKLQGSANLHFIWNDATGTASSLDLGTGFLGTDTSSTYRIRIWKQSGIASLNIELYKTTSGGTVTVTSLNITSDYNTGSNHNAAIWMGNNTAVVGAVSFKNYGCQILKRNLVGA